MTIQKIMRPVLGLALAVSVSTVAVADDVRIKIAGTFPAQHFGTAIMEEMVQEIEDADVGLSVSFFPASQLGSGEELIEDAIRGNIDIVQGFVYAQADPRLEVMNLPVLVTTFEEMIEMYGDPQSNFNQVMREILADLGLVYLNIAGEGLVGIVASEMPADPNGLGDKGMNIRVWSSEIAKLATESMGYRTTTMNWAEVLPALQAGVIDGAICCTPEWAYSTFAVADVGGYYIPVNLSMEATALYASQETWDELNEEQREVIQAASTRAAERIMNQAWERSEGFYQQMIDAGWQILDYTPEQRATMVDHVRATVWPQLAEVIGQDTMDRLVAR